MAQAAVKLYGYTGLRKSLMALSKDTAPVFREAHRSAADKVLDAARPKSPHRSGALASSLKSSSTKNRATVRVGSPSVPYGAPIHWGWPSRPNPEKGWRGGPIAANPWVWDAAVDLTEEILDDIALALTRAFAELGMEYPARGG